MITSWLRSGGAQLWRVMLSIALCLGALTAPQVSAASVQSSTHASAANLSPALQSALRDASPNEMLRVIVRFKQQADLRSARASIAPQPERSASLRRVVVDALQDTAQSSLLRLQAHIAQRGIASQVAQLRPFWIFNGAALQATPQAIQIIAKHPEVASMEVDEWRRWLTPTLDLPFDAPRQSQVLVAARIADANVPPSQPPWGVTQIRADEVWSALGITGTGVTVGIIDSGVDWQHPLLQSSYRGWRPVGLIDHLRNWLDATDETSAYPTDMNGHGTHVMGTIVGQNGVGIAPGARWIAAKAFNPSGYGLDSWLHAALEFMLAPGGDPAYAPDVVSNSWSNDDGALTTFLSDIDALQTAGVLVLFANGNRGPSDGSVGSPASLPNGIGIGATDSDDEIAYFSSRGPSHFGGIRPQLSAPGVDVLSTYPGGQYATASGTSMAAPHVAGAAALLFSAKPALSAIGALEVLTRTAVPLSTTLPNNESGWGRIDAYSAVLSVVSTGVITGTVQDGAQPISASLVTVFGDSHRITTLTNASGVFTVLAPAGIYTASASAYGFYPAVATAPFLVTTNQIASINMTLQALPSGVARGTVMDAVTGVALTQTLVTALGTPRSSLANNGGQPPYRYFLDLPAGDYTIEARMLGYQVQTRTVTISDGSITDANFTLTPTQRIALVDSGAWYYRSTSHYYRAALDELEFAYDEYRVKHPPADAPTIAQLSAYDVVIWSAPYDSPGIAGGSTALAQYLQMGRNLLIAGQDVGYYDGGGQWMPLAYFEKLNAIFMDDSTTSRVIAGAPASLWAGKTFTITGGDGADNQELVDAIAIKNADYGNLLGRFIGATAYRDGAGTYTQQCRPYRAAYLTFGFEAINTASDRVWVMRSVLDAFDKPRPTVGIELLSLDTYATGAPIGLPGEVLSHQLRLRHIGDAGSSDTFSLTLSGNAWASSLSDTAVQLAPCASTALHLSVTIPPTATWNTGDIVTLTAVSAMSPALQSIITFTTKTPAPVLLVDDDRFINREADYIADLAANGNIADRWDTQWESGYNRSPTLALLNKYPIVLWYTAYDWHDPLSPAEEEMLRQYLADGGRLFLSSQSALYVSGMSPLMRTYLGVGSVDFTDTTSNVVGAPGTVVGSGFTSSSMLPFPYNWNLSSAVQPTLAASVVLRGDSGQPFGLVSECGAVCAGLPAWRTAFMPFAFETLQPNARADLLNRVTGWLSWFGASSLTPEQPHLAAGGRMTWTVQLRADDVISHSIPVSPALGQRVLVNVPLDAHLNVIASTLDASTAHNAGAWQGELPAGGVLTWTFVTTATQGLTISAPLTAEMGIRLLDSGLNFTRSASVVVNAPQLSTTLRSTPAHVGWDSVVTVTLRVTNTGALDAPAILAMNTLPTGLGLLTSTVMLEGGGVVGIKQNRIDWSGGLNSGRAITITYAISVPRYSKNLPPAFFNSAQVTAGAATIQSAEWLIPSMPMIYLPVMLR